MARRKSKKKKSGKLLGFLFLLVFLLGIWFGVNVYNNGGGLQGVLATILGQKYAEFNNLDTKYVLVLGISEDINAKLTDTIMIGAYNPKTQKAALISISRDTFVGSSMGSAKASDKLNAIYASKGVDGVLKKVNNLTGLDIKDYVIVNNKALVDIVDAIGGVKYDVPIDMEYDDPTQDLHIKLKKGMQKIDGEKAEWLLRFRHNNDGSSYPSTYGDNDLGRMKTQREFIKETVKQTVSLKNIFKIKKLSDAVFNNVETNLDKDTIYAYATCAINFETENLNSYVLPGSSKMLNSLWFSVYSEESGKKLLSEIKTFLDTKAEKIEAEETAE